MKINQSFIKLITLILIILYSKSSIAEPFVVLEYRNNIDNENILSDNLFLKDLNYSSQHIVLKNETLSDIMLNYYGTKSFNNNILSLAIVHFNKKAFVRHNPNYLYSGKKLYLPSINEIKNLIIKKKKDPSYNDRKKESISSQIYFFGGWLMFIAMFKFSLIFLSMLFVSKQAIALSGEDISKKISEWLITENVIGEPVFSKKSIYKDCLNDIKMTRPFKNYKTIKVSCPDQNGFEVLVRVRTKTIKIKQNKSVIEQKTLPIKKNIKNIKEFKSIKLKRALERNDVIELSDLELVLSKKSSNNSFYNNKKDLVGRKIKQNLKMGQLLHPRHLYEKFDIQSGDYLSIVSSVGTASVAVSGKALDSGNLGDLIKVQNLRSGSVIKGYVKKNKIIKVYR